MKALKTLSILLAALCISCTEHTYTELHLFDYEKAVISDNDEVNILNFSGGKDCTPEITYYYSVIAVVAETKDTVRILTPCQLLSTKFSIGSFRVRGYIEDSLLNSVGFKSGEEEYVVSNSKLPFQNRSYPVAIGSIGFRDDNNEILKDELRRKGTDTSILDAPQTEISRNL